MSRPTSSLASRQVHTSWFVAVLSILIGFSPLAIDMGLPAMPAMAQAFEATQAEIQLSLSAYMVGFCISQVLWGPLGDWLGRRVPVSGGILLFVIASAGCALSSGPHELAAWRFVQAIGAGAAPVLARAMVRDVYAQDEAARTLSLMMLIMSGAPMIAPLIGAQLLIHISWQAIYWCLAVFGCIALVALWTVPETLPPDKRHAHSLRDVAAGYVPLFKSPMFLSYAISSTCFIAALLTYVAATPFVYIEYFGLPAQYYGVLFAANIIGMTIFNLVNRRLVRMIGSQRALQWGAITCGFAGVVLAICGVTGAFGLAGIAVPLFVFLSMNGLVTANAMAGAMSAVPGTAGTASGLSGAMQYGAGALLSWLVGVLADGTPSPMVLAIAVMGLGSVLFACVMPRWLHHKNG